MNTIADKIGEEYKQWGACDKIFISSPTGTGKTYFILNILLPFVAGQNKKMLYLVNRRILKEQLETEISSFLYDLHNAIEIELYQTIENKLCEISLRHNSQNGQDYYMASGMNTVNLYSQYDYVICDECHYFLADANFNTNTAISFWFVKNGFHRKTQIFLSATIKDIQNYILEDNEKWNYYHTNYYEFCSINLNGTEKIQQGKVWEYSLDKKYDYINIHIIRKIKDIIDRILIDNDKWLIFVDEKKVGRRLKKQLVARFKEEGWGDDSEIVMLSSDYDKEEESANEVVRIVKNSEQSAKVLISTSVMDNGISLKDISLRNIVLMADTEVEFIQMLGRKREDGEKTDLYIYKYVKSHFEKRLMQIQKIRKVIEGYFDMFVIMIKAPLAKTDSLKLDIREYNAKEWLLIDRQHKILVNEIVGNKVRYDYVTKAFFAYNGIFYLNLLAFQNVENLNTYYKEIITKFNNEQDNDNVFVREQLRWLKLPEDEIEKIISDSEKTMLDRCKENVNSILSDKSMREMDESEKIELKKNIKDDLLVLAEAVSTDVPERNSVINGLKKNDRPISKKHMDFFEEHCGILFGTEKDNGVED